MLLPPDTANNSVYEVFGLPTITGPAARMFGVQPGTNTCTGTIQGGGVCSIYVLFAPTYQPPAGETFSATLNIDFQLCQTPIAYGNPTGPAVCQAGSGAFSLGGTVTGSAPSNSGAQIQITPTQPVLLQPGNYGSLLSRDYQGNILASVNNTIVEFSAQQAYTPNSTPNVVAGNGGPGGTNDGLPATTAGINPSGIAVPWSHTIYAVDSGQGVVRDFSIGGNINLFIGQYGLSCVMLEQSFHVGLEYSGGCYGGTYPNADLVNPSILATDGLNLFIDDAGSFTIREYSFTNNATNTIAGYAGIPYFFEGYNTVNVYPGDTGDGGLASLAQLNGLGSMAVDASSNVYFTDAIDSVIRKIDISNTISNFLGQGPGNNSSFPVGSGNGPAAQATLNDPSALTFDQQGNMYVFDDQGYQLREVQINGGVPITIGTLYSPPSGGTYLPPPGAGTPVVDATGEILISPYTNLPAGIYSTPYPTPGIYEMLGNGVLTFPQVGAGTPELLTATITNPGSAELQIYATAIDGPNSADFTIATNASTCGNSLNANSSCTITVKYDPTEQYTSTTRTATLYLSTNVGTGNQVITLSGTTYALPTLAPARSYSPYYDWPQPSTAVAAVTASSGVPPYTFSYTITPNTGSWSLLSGTTTASIDGIPTQVGPVYYSITVTDSVGATATMSGSFTVSQSPSFLSLSATQTALPSGTAVAVAGTVTGPSLPQTAGVLLPSGQVQFQFDNNPVVFEAIPVAYPNAEPTSTYSFNIDILYHTLTGTYAGDTNYLAAVIPQTLTFNGNRPQTITFHGGLNAPNGSLISLTAYASSGLPVTYAVTSGPGYIDYTGSRLMLSGTGQVQVKATQAGNLSFAPANPVTVNFFSY